LKFHLISHAAGNHLLHISCDMKQGLVTLLHVTLFVPEQTVFRNKFSWSNAFLPENLEPSAIYAHHSSNIKYNLGIQSVLWSSQNSYPLPSCFQSQQIIRVCAQAICLPWTTVIPQTGIVRCVLFSWHSSGMNRPCICMHCMFWLIAAIIRYL
jgi:hypothetical protein